MFNRSLVHACALVALGACASATAFAVRIDPDGHGQVLIYPYYNARPAAEGSFVTAISVTNIAAKPKAVKVRVHEGKAGAEVLDFNLFLDSRDVWTAGIIGLGESAGLVTSDLSCTSLAPAGGPVPVAPFRNSAYVGDLLGDGLDRTYEGYIEILEMGTIEPGTDLERAISHAAGYGRQPNCIGLPATDDVPPGLTKPSGGLMGNVSYININQGTDFSVDAIALSYWSDKVQWSPPGRALPDLASASPASSVVIDSREDGDTLYATRWVNGRDAVSALFMSDRVLNEYTVEPAIKAATEWVLTMPTKRFYVNRVRSEAPFLVGAPNTSRSAYHCEPVAERNGSPKYYDRETQDVGGTIDFAAGIPHPQRLLCGAASAMTFNVNAGSAPAVRIFAPTQTANYVLLNAGWINGWLDFEMQPESYRESHEASRLRAPAGSTTAIDLTTGNARTGLTVTYVGLPVIGFAAQSYSTTGLPGVSTTVLSNYGGQFGHRFVRAIEVSQ